MTDIPIRSYATENLELVEGFVIVDKRKDCATQVIGKSGVLRLTEDIDVVDYFKYLGCTVWADGSESEEISARIKAAATTFGMMRKVLTQKNIDKAVRVGVWKCFVMSVLLKGSGTWCPTATEIEALERSAHRHLRSTLGLRTHKVEGEWDTASRERIRGLAAIPKFSQILRERRLHVRRTIMCFPSTSIVRAPLEEEDWEVRTIHHSMDWGKRTAQDMRDCGLTVEMAELPSEWNKRSAAEKTKKDIPYTDAEEAAVFHVCVEWGCRGRSTSRWPGTTR